MKKVHEKNLVGKGTRRVSAEGTWGRVPAASVRNTEEAGLCPVSSHVW